MEIKEMLNSIIQVFDIDVLKFVFNIICSLFGILGTALTCLGVSLSKLFITLSDFKNRKTLKYPICNRVFGKLNKDICWRFLMPLLEIIWFSLIPLIMLVIIYILLVLVNVITICTFNGEKGYLIALILLIGVVISGLLGKKLNDCRKSNCIKLLFLMGYSLFALVVYSVFLCSTQQVLKLIALISIGLEFSLIYFSYKQGAYRYYKNTLCDVISRCVRYIVIIVTILNLTIKLDNNNLFVFFWIWVLLVIFEYTVNINDEDVYADITIHTVEGDKQTKCRIMQYENHRVKYKLKDGTTEIVKDTDILYISYQLPKLLQMKFLESKKRINIKCVLKDAALNEILSYKINSYKFVGESWIRLSLQQYDKEENVIINVNRVKKLTEYITK